MLVLVCVIGTLRECQAFSKVPSSYGLLAYLSDIFIPGKNVVFSAHFSNNGLVQDSCMLVLVCVIGTLREFQACLFQG